MTAYVILDIKVTDPALYEEYKQIATPTVTQYGGKYIARGGKVETMEGDWSPARMVILEFESVDQAKRWLNSPEYSQAKELRQRASVSKVVVVEGV
jgi:uncharacterized protein (DUF1330 family)